MHIPCIPMLRPRLMQGEEQKQSPWLANRGFQGLTEIRVTKTLAVSSDGAKLPGKEMIGWPRSADRYLAVFQLLGSGAVAVLVFFDALGIDQVSDIDEHACRSDFFAADFLFQRVKQLVYLD